MNEYSSKIHIYVKIEFVNDHAWLESFLEHALSCSVDEELLET
jgi:hypothetical protein